MKHFWGPWRRGEGSILGGERRAIGSSGVLVMDPSVWVVVVGALLVREEE